MLHLSLRVSRFESFPVVYLYAWYETPSTTTPGLRAIAEFSDHSFPQLPNFLMPGRDMDTAEPRAFEEYAAFNTQTAITTKLQAWHLGGEDRRELKLSTKFLVEDIHVWI